MNRSFFEDQVAYMIGVGFKKLGHTPIPKLPSSSPPPPPPPRDWEPVWTTNKKNGSFRSRPIWQLIFQEYLI